MVDATTIQLVRETWTPVYALGADGAMLFYNKLFEAEPEVKNLFKNSDLRVQAGRLFKMINTAVEKLDDVGTLLPVLRDLGRRHVEYGVRPEHYPPVGGALLGTLAIALGDKFTPEVKAAWTTVYTIVADTMVEGASQDPDAAKVGYKAQKPIAAEISSSKPAASEGKSASWTDGLGLPSYTNLLVAAAVAGAVVAGVAIKFVSRPSRA